MTARPFGRPGCVTPAAFAAIGNDTLKAEAVLIAFETGLSETEVAAATGLDCGEVRLLRTMKLTPFQRPSEAI